MLIPFSRILNILVNELIAYFYGYVKLSFFFGLSKFLFLVSPNSSLCFFCIFWIWIYVPQSLYY